jgi:C-terminal processing protease CtpA/Prc
MGTDSRTRRASATTSRRRRGRPAETASLAAPFLAEAAEPVRDHLAGSVTLPEFLQGAGTLSLDERRLLVEQALVMLEQNYVHLPLKVAMHAVSPLQRLRLFRVRLERQTPETTDPEWLFHAELSRIFHSVRDLHTNYLLPDPFAGKIAYLPFQVEEYFDASGSHYVVSRLATGFSAPGFGPGAKVTHWSGMPIDRAVELNAARFAGSNPAARHARGVDSLTIRPLLRHLPPDEEWVTVGYAGTDGQARELRQPWLVVDNLPPFEGPGDEADAFLGVDLDLDQTNRAKTLLFAPQVVDQAQADRSSALTTIPAAAGEEVPTLMPGLFRARNVPTSSGTFGHIRIFSFNLRLVGVTPDQFVAEFIRLIGLLSQSGLIVDVRGNGGGHIWASEFTLQTLTPRRIVPEPTQFINTPLNLRICRNHREKDDPFQLWPWIQSMDQATETGATFSAAFAITPEDRANAIGQQYYGPVVLVTDARCYSATDIFAAGFQDHGIGPILGVDDNTGAGGANVWDHQLLSGLLQDPPDPDSPYKALPNGANMRVAIRRTVRVGALAGTPLEDLGVRPDQRHPMTRRDVLEGNLDLLDQAGELLAAMPLRRLDVHPDMGADGTLLVKLEVENIDRADLYVDDRPRGSVDVAGGGATAVVTGVGGARLARVEGFSDGQLVAARTITLQDVS